MSDVKYTPEDLIDHHAIAAIFRDDQGRALMLHHRKWGFWTFPVGKAHADQTPIAGLKEEMREELDVEVIDQRELVDAPVRYVRDGKEITLRLHVYEIESYGGSIRNLEPAKHDELSYMDDATIAGLPELSDATLLYLRSKSIPTNATFSGEVLAD